LTEARLVECPVDCINFFLSATRAGHQDLQLMRSSYGFKKFLQAIYVVFGRAAIVTSHDAGVVFASDSRHRRDASLHRAMRSTERTPRASRIFIDKNSLFCDARCWRPLFVMFLHACRASGTKPQTSRAAPKNHIEKIFKNFSDAIVCARILHAEARAQASCIASKLSRAMRSHPGL